MFDITFIITTALYLIASAQAVLCLHTDEEAHYSRSKGLFFAAVVSFLLLGVVRFRHGGAAGLLQGAFTIWGYFYLMALCMNLVLLYLYFSRWKSQWRFVSGIAIPITALLLLVSVPFLGSGRKIALEISTGLLPLHIVVATLGELLFLLSFIGSALYLIMEWQLKKKASMKFVYRLPTLESIERFNRWAIMRAFFLLTIGLASGIIMACMVFGSPFQGSPKEVILYASWIILLGLSFLRFRSGIHPHRLSQINAAVFAVVIFIFVFSNVYFTRGFHSFR